MTDTIEFLNFICITHMYLDDINTTETFLKKRDRNIDLPQTNFGVKFLFIVTAKQCIRICM